MKSIEKVKRQRRMKNAPFYLFGGNIKGLINFTGGRGEKYTSPKNVKKKSKQQKNVRINRKQNR